MHSTTFLSHKEKKRPLLLSFSKANVTQKRPRFGCEMYFLQVNNLLHLVVSATTPWRYIGLWSQITMWNCQCTPPPFDSPGKKSFTSVSYSLLNQRRRTHIGKANVQLFHCANRWHFWLEIWVIWPSMTPMSVCKFLQMPADSTQCLSSWE